MTKDIMESAEAFEAYARIDYCNFAIRKLLESREYDYEVVKDLLKETINSKKLIEADISNEERTLKEIEDLQKSQNADNKN